MTAFIIIIIDIITITWSKLWRAYPDIIVLRILINSTLSNYSLTNANHMNQFPHITLKVRAHNHMLT